jgi:ribosome-binding factor A
MPLGQRQLRVAALVREGLAEMLSRGQVHDPALDGASITVSEVQMSPDLRHARVFVTTLGGAREDDALAALKRAAPLLAGQIGRRLKLRFAPKLAFLRDTTFADAARIESLLQPRRSEE